MAFCTSLGWGALPIALCAVTGGSFVTTYAIAVAKGDVRAFFPYISDTGSQPPESCIFSLCLNIAGWIALGVMFLRYKQIEATSVFASAQNGTVLRRRNFRALVAGCLSVSGLILVANFQDSNVLTVHTIGAVSVFFFGGVYEVVNAQISRALGRHGEARMQIASLIITYIGMAAAVIGGAVALLTRPKYIDNVEAISHWASHDRGYAAHVVSTVGEWLMGVSFLGFFLSYVRTFRGISLSVSVGDGLAAEWADGAGGKESPGQCHVIASVNEDTPLLH